MGLPSLFVESSSKFLHEYVYLEDFQEKMILVHDRQIFPCPHTALQESVDPPPQDRRMHLLQKIDVNWLKETE